MEIKAKFSKFTLLAALFAVFTFSSCESIYDEQGDCTTHYLLNFKYDMNMKFADAFHNEVSHVQVNVYDVNTGELLKKQFASGEVLKNEDYRMELTDLKPGVYDIVAWCGDGLKDNNFILYNEDEMTDNYCLMKRIDYSIQTPKSYSGEIGNGIINGSYGVVRDDVGKLYHGIKRVEFNETYGTHERTIELVKNTNVVRVVLQHLSGVDVNPDDFAFEISDCNGRLGYDNTVLPDQQLYYEPWSVTAGKAGINADIYGSNNDTGDTQTSVSVALAEFTVNRLVTENNPILSIYNVKDGKRILAIPLKDYALLVKGNYNKNMSDQEYLDRQDEYNLTFFLDEFGNWASSRIIINSWSLVLSNSDLQ